jgi:hypothetical protein
VKSHAPKFRPETVSNCEPLKTMFRGPVLTDATSKVYPGTMVPTAAPTVTGRNRSVDE